jgi:hypothetical protein
MSERRLTDHLDYMRQAAADACCFVQGLSKKRISLGTSARNRRSS